LDVVANYNDLCGECPIWDHSTGALYWTDCAGLKFYKYLPGSKHHELIKSGLEINSYRFNEPGGFVIANNSGIWLWDGDEKTNLIASEVDGAKCQMNDCISDPAGRLYSASCFYDPQRDYLRGKLMRVDINGKVTILDDGFDLPNGFAFSLDYKTLYFTDSVARRIYAYDYHQASGDLRRRRVLVQVPLTEGLPDGLITDSEGFLWSAQWYGSCVVRYDPDGKIERRITTPAKQTSCMGFGGPDMNELFITTAARPEPMPVMPPGYDPHSGFTGGPLYRIRVEVPGRWEHETKIRLTPSPDPSPQN